MHLTRKNDMRCFPERELVHSYLMQRKMVFFESIMLVERCSCEWTSQRLLRKLGRIACLYPAFLTALSLELHQNVIKFDARMKDGKRCSGSIPYGYNRLPSDKQTLVVDPVASEVVKHMSRRTPSTATCISWWNPSRSSLGRS